MNLECPGCQARLKIDPEKLPAGATTALCPRCKTKVLLPGAVAPQGDLTIQCPGCSARLRVNASRLKPAASQSRCPKCGGAVDLPAAPASAPAPPPGAPSPALQGAQMTRRIDPRDLGVVLGGAAAQPASPAGRPAAAPIDVEAPQEFADTDLSRLIESKVEKLGDDTSRRFAAASRGAAAAPSPVPVAPPVPPPAAPAEIAASAMTRRLDPKDLGLVFGDSAAGPSKAPAAPLRPAAQAEAPPPPAPARAPSASGSRPAPALEPRFTAAAPAADGGMAPSLLAGAGGGAIVGGVMAVVSSLIPANLVAAVPGAFAAAGPRTTGVVLTIALSALAALVSKPASASGGAGRSALAGVVLGAVTGAGLGLAGGSLDPLGIANWVRDLGLSGLLAGLLGRFTAGR